MPRTIHRLSAVQVRQLLDDSTAEGRYADGNGLYLQIDNSGGKSWIFIWRRGGRRRVMGLGPARTVTLADARKLAKEADAMVRKGDDPIVERKRQIVGALTFGQAAQKCFAEVEAGWRSHDHRIVWQRSLTAHAKSLLSKPVCEVTTDDVAKVLRPLWLTKYETAIRLRGRIERILDWAKANDHREGENPAVWKGNLKHRLPTQPRKLQRTKHHPALPYDEIPAFMAKLRATEGVGARVLEFLILPAARSKEALSAQWTEINFEQALWTLPGERMKAGILMSCRCASAL